MLFSNAAALTICIIIGALLVLGYLYYTLSDQNLHTPENKPFTMIWFVICTFGAGMIIIFAILC